MQRNKIKRHQMKRPISVLKSELREASSAIKPINKPMNMMN